MSILRKTAMALVLAGSMLLARDSKIAVGDRAPQLGLEKLLQAPAGTIANWEALKGNVVVLEFWGTRCLPCMAAFPHLNQLAEEFKDQPVRFIAITNDEQSPVQRFVEKRPIRGWIGLDTDESVFAAYGVDFIPKTVVVDKNGEVAAITDPTSLDKQLLRDVLAGKRSRAVSKK